MHASSRLKGDSRGSYRFRLRGYGAVATLAMILACMAPSVARAQATLYWDTNGSTYGAGSTPTGTWSTSASNKDWNSSILGTSTTAQWTDGSNAVFSAGTDATGSFNVTVSGTVNANSLTVSMGAPTLTGGTINLSGSPANVWVISGATGTINSVITGSNGLTKIGAGTLVLGNSANTYTGATTISAGTLQLATSNALPTGSAVSVSSGATLNVNNQTQTIGSIAGAGAVTLGTGSLTAGGDNTSTSFGGTLSGTGTFTKTGTGTLSLTSNISFGGTMVLSAGTLQLSGNTLTLGTLNITGNSVIDFAGSAAKLNVTNLFIQSGATLTITNWQDGVDYLYASNWSGATYLASGSNPMNQVAFSGFSSSNTKWLSWDNQISPVPEPATYGAILLTATLLGAWWFRARARSVRQVPTELSRH